MVPDKYKSVKLKTKIDDFFIEKICQMGKNVIEIAKLKKIEKNCYIHGKKNVIWRKFGKMSKGKESSIWKKSLNWKKIVKIFLYFQLLEDF